MYKFWMILSGILMLSFIWTQNPAISTDDEILAKVGDEVITKIDFETRLKSFSSAQQREMQSLAKRKELLDIMVKERLFFLEGKKRGLTEKPEIQAQLRMFRDNLILQEYTKAYLEEKAAVSEEEAQQYYQTEPEIKEQELIKVSEIVVQREEEAREILERLRKGEPFKKLAYERSVDKVGRLTGGELDVIEKGRGEKEVEEAVSKLEKGGISDIVKRKGKYSIFKLDNRNVFPKPPFIRLKKEIIQKLKYQKMLELAGKEIEELRKKILVETFYDRLTQEGK